jgi:GxxExxY protein
VGEEGKINHQGHQEGHQGRGAVGDADAVARAAVDAGLRVHKALGPKALGPGLLESTYEHCLAHELCQQGFMLERQVVLPVVYGGITLDAAYRIDLIVANCLIIEVKAVDLLTRLHVAQLLTYLRLSGYRIGLLMNFNVELFKQGVKRLII